MDGIFVIDKPVGPTSHDICEYFKKVLGFKKVGHAGTLDPLASGILVVLTGRATKMQSVFLGQDKEYSFTLRLGETTDTYDAQGKTVAKREIPSDYAERLPEILKEFLGEIAQIPPKFSALKIRGTPMYRLARQGVDVQAAPRKIRISALEIIGFKSGDVEMKMSCSSGTYVRSLAHDLGDRLGCGGHVVALRRLRSEPFGIEEAMPLKEDFSLFFRAKNRSKTVLQSPL